jgi:hypothetical protein
LKIEKLGKVIFQYNEVSAQAFLEEKFSQHVGFFSTSILIVILYGFSLLQITKFQEINWLIIFIIKLTRRECQMKMKK